MKHARVALVISVLALAIVVLDALHILPTMNVFGHPTRTGTLIIEDTSGKPRMILTARSRDAPSISLLDESGVVRLEVSLTPTNVPGLSLLSPSGTSRLTASLRGQNGQPELTLYDKAGRYSWRVWLNEDGEPVMLPDDGGDE